MEMIDQNPIEGACYGPDRIFSAHKCDDGPPVPHSYGQLREEQDRRDAIQETLLKAWTGLHRLRSPEYFETWIIRILINECHNQQRRMRRLAPIDAAPEPAGEDFNGDADVRDAILRLPEKQRIPIILHYMEGYKVDEIAHILRIPSETVRSRLRRARIALKDMLE